MKVKEEGKTTIKFPIQKYFQQIFSNSAYVTIINPFKFWRRYRIEHLESCYEYNLILFLDRCLRKERQPVKQNQENNSTSSREDRSLSFNQQNPNVILISQPNYELKYRGVSYRSHSIYMSNRTGIEIKLDRQSSVQPEIVPVDSSDKDNPKTSHSI